jgi:hypothetical protein
VKAAYSGLEREVKDAAHRDDGKRDDQNSDSFLASNSSRKWIQEWPLFLASSNLTNIDALQRDLPFQPRQLPDRL